MIIKNVGVLLMPEAKDRKLTGGQIRFCETSGNLREVLSAADVKTSIPFADCGIVYEDNIAPVRSRWDAGAGRFGAVAGRPSSRIDGGAATFMREK
ncbi:MAG: hypothetical protein HYS81_05275 [Candidatus Aenigmatarchaeota archaeon]|nr:MAG: hypothetical protein HYS81_05275 [Candidatus Aenigmarchaeota archaeon]